MKIAHLTTHLNPGGIPSYILTLAEELQKNQISSLIISSGGLMQTEFEKINIPCFNFPIKTKFEFHPKLFLCLPQMIQRVRVEKIKLLHAHTRVAQVLAWFISQRTKIPFVTTCHGFYQPRLGRRILPAWGQKAVAISEGVRQDLIKKHRVDPEKIQTIHNGVKTKTIAAEIAKISSDEARTKFGFQKENFVACMIARLVKEKGTQDFLQALRSLILRYPHVRGLVVGDGREREKLQAEVKAWGLENQIKFLGQCQNIFLPLAACDVFVHPARWAEAFGLSIVEAMAAGKPVLMTTNWALYEFLKDKPGCFFVEKGDVSQIEMSLEAWVQSPQKVTQMGMAARMLAQEYFDSANMAKEISKVYRDSV